MRAPSSHTRQWTWDYGAGVAAKQRTWDARECQVVKALEMWLAAKLTTG
jgi:hypothetical protein